MASDQNSAHPVVGPQADLPPNGGQREWVVPNLSPLGTAKQQLAPKRVLQKKGNDLSDQDLALLSACIQRRGEAVPGEMAQELGWARSSLAYNLNRLLKRGWIVRLGGGRNIRYRTATPEEEAAFRQREAGQESQPRKDKPPQKMGWFDRLKKFLAD